MSKVISGLCVGFCLAALLGAKISVVMPFNPEKSDQAVISKRTASLGADCTTDMDCVIKHPKRRF